MKNLILKLGAALVATFTWSARSSRHLARTLGSATARLGRSRPVRIGGRIALRAGRITAFAALITGFALFVGWMGFHRVVPGMIGVKQVNFGGGGIVQQDFTGGLHFGIRGYHSWHEVDGRTQLLSYGWSAEPADTEHLKVRTADGNYVRIGLAVPFHVIPGRAHELVEAGLKSTYRQRVQTAVEKVLSTEFGRLKTEEFWNVDLRSACIATALPRLNRELASLYVEAQDVLIENFRFNPEYEDRLQQVQLDSLRGIVDATRNAVEEEQNRIDRTLREIERAASDLTLELKRQIDTENDAGRKRIEAKLTEARFYDQTVRARGTYEFERLVSEGEREVAQVEQSRIAAENQGYDSRGGRMMLARQAAENLKFKQVTLNSNDPRSPSVLDVDELVRLLAGSSLRAP